MEPKVSVIIPVYNVENYLRECLDSLQCQETDFEVILIDDGSQDASGRICDEDASSDTRFRVFHIINGGPATARNIGLEKAKGEWITFVDSDDRIEAGYLSIPEMHKDVDLIYANFRILSSDSSVNSYTWGIEDESIIDMNSINLLCMQCFDIYIREPRRKLGSTWGKFFKRFIVMKYNIIFPQGLSFYEDACFTWNYFQHIKSVYFIGKQEPSYIYRKNEESLTNQTNLNTIVRRKKAIYYIDSDIYDIHNTTSFGRFYIDQFLYALSTISRSAKSIPELFKWVSDLYQWEPWKRIFSKHLTYKEFAPLTKQFLIIKSRLAYVLALKLYLSNGKK